MSELKLRVISLGAGVQSTTLALMAAHGEIGPMPDCAIFADTGDEPKAVYEHLDWLMSPNVLPFPVRITSKGGVLSENFLAGDQEAQPPIFTEWRAGETGMLRRQCTRNYKIKPLKREMRRLCPKGRVEVWIGISTDEIQRIKDPDVKWQINRWPLIEKQMSRRDCISWLSAKGYPQPPKSSCWHCPYQKDAQWRDKRDNSPDEWEKAVAFDVALRTSGIDAGNAPCFLHRSLKPLSEADLSTPAERGQIEFGFLQECDGMCGV